MSLEAIPNVSVIVPNYNHARYLRRRIDSILQQTYSDFELILLDDCSTDDSRETIGRYAANPRVRTEFNEQNSGSVFKQWNKGVRMARGRYIWIAESDDYADPRFLGRMIPILEEHAEITFAYCRSWSVGEDDQSFGFADSYLKCLDANHWATDFVVDGPEECRRFFALVGPVPNASAVIFRKDIYEAVGLADEGLRVCGDYKVWAAMAFEGKIAYLAEPLNYFRSHRENVRTRAETGALGVAEYFYVMLSVLDRIAPLGAITQRSSMNEVLSRLPFELSPRERIQRSQQSLSCIAEWNLRHNLNVPGEAIRAYLTDWKFALIGTEFSISPPSRWRFFIHRCRFYQSYFSRMNWKLRFVNLMRVLGAPVVGYRHRHLPQRAFTWVMRMLNAP
jgi:glycosyltransferase involved in cell wall biosynthesis